MANSFLAFIAREGGQIVSDVIRLKLAAPPKKKQVEEEAAVTKKEVGEDIELTQIISSEVKEAPTAATTPPESALEPHTLDYQLDQILDDLGHLETEHLPSKGKLNGIPCDCIAKAGRSLRRHARETIPIAAREGKDTAIFDQMAEEGNYLMEIGTLEAVQSGQYDAEYLQHSGVVSNLRKSLDKMYAEVKSGSTPGCPECEELRRLSRQWIERRAVEQRAKVEQPTSES